MVTKLHGDLTVLQAEGALNLLLDAAGGGEDLDLDTTGVTAVDAAGLQLLWAAVSDARRSGAAMSLTEGRMGPVVAAAWRAAGLPPLPSSDTAPEGGIDG